MIKKYSAVLILAAASAPAIADRSDAELLAAEAISIPVEKLENEKGNRAVIVDTDSSLDHEVSSLVSYRDNSYQVFFNKPAPSNNFTAIQHECGTSSLKHRFFLNPKSKSFEVKRSMIEEGTISSIGYKCVKYKKWGEVAMIKIVRASNK